MKNLLILICIMPLAWSCGNSKKALKKNEPMIQSVLLAMDFSEYTRNSSETEIINASIMDSTLTLNVKYNGGCKDHTFELIGSKIIQKSMPAVRGIILVHNAYSDDCREVIEQELKFNISDFKYPNGDIYLKLNGYKERILFKSID